MWRHNVSRRNMSRKCNPHFLPYFHHYVSVGETRNVYRILVGKPKEKRPLRRHRRKWKGGVKLDLKQGARVWTELKWRAFVNSVLNLWIIMAENFSTSWGTISVSKRTLLHGAKLAERGALFPVVIAGTNIN